jgi:acyl-coenzyme A synthetase/AMP-(fatty) acid ligase/3-hydroxymyristoyl/3-hydroxydecanoyl-(acyl carrier protein) dehydratase
MLSGSSQPATPVPLSRLLVDARRPADSLVAFGRAGDYDFADFRARVAAVAAAVSDAGRGPWLLFTTDAYGFAVALAALVYSGSTAVLAPNAQPGTLAELAARTVGRLLPSALARQVPSALPTLDPLSVTGESAAGFEAPDPLRPAIEMFTSGTTGSGKPVTKALAHVEDEVVVLERRFGALLGPTTRTFSTVSCQHLYGLLFRVLWPLVAGRPFQADTLLRPEELLPRMMDAGDCTLAATPAHLHRFGAPAGVEPLRSVCRAVFSSGGPLEAETAAAVARGLGTAPIEIFGSTETGGVAWRRRDTGNAHRDSGVRGVVGARDDAGDAGRAREGAGDVLDAREGSRARGADDTADANDDPTTGAHDGSAWTPLDGVRVDREPATGRLVVCSPFVSVGEPSGRQTGTGTDRRALLAFTMGDCARMTEDGGFELLGRSDRVVKVGEKRLSLPDMERHLLSHPAVAEASVLPFERAGATRLRAVVATTDEGRTSLADEGRRALAKHLGDHLAPYFDRVLLPRAWRFVDTLPRDAQGKPALALLAALFETKPAAATDLAAAEAPGKRTPSPGQAGPSFPIVMSERRDERTLERRLHVPPDLTFLEGHFDGFPIVAGVVQVHWVLSAARELLGHDPELRAIEALKFKELLTPGQDFDMKVEVNESRDRVYFLLSDDVRVFSSGRCLLASPA